MMRLALLTLTIVTGVASGTGFVPPEVAFGMNLSAVAPGQYVLEADVLPGFALYQDKLRIVAEGATIRSIHVPDGVTINDPELGDERVLSGHVSIPIAVDVQTGHTAPQLILRYQGCKVDEMCYPPQIIRFQLAAR